jgi:AbrB family looped-hinge helix DNA binding protein
VHELTISARFLIIIPKGIREMLNLRPGQKVRAIVREGHIELIPVRHGGDLRGSLRGIDTRVRRDGDRV